MQVGEFLKQTLLSTLMAAWTWPSYIVKSFKYIDSPWTVGIDRADKAGAVLAQVLLVRGWRWLTPVAEFLTRRCTTGSQTGAAACDVVWVGPSRRCVRLQHAPPAHTRVVQVFHRGPCRVCVFGASGQGRRCRARHRGAWYGDCRLCVITRSIHRAHTVLALAQRCCWERQCHSLASAGSLSVA